VPEASAPPAGKDVVSAPDKVKDHDLWLHSRVLGLDPSVREKLISRYLPLVRIAARKMAMLSAHPFDSEDCHGPGALALVKAVDSFDHSRGVPFEAFAYPRIHGAMVDHLRSQDWVPRGVRAAVQKLRRACDQLAGKNGRPPDDEEVAAHLALSVTEFGFLAKRATPAQVMSLEALDQSAGLHPTGGATADATGSPSARLELQELVGLVSKAMARLSKSEHAVIVSHYHEGLMFKEVAKNLRRSRARISQLHTVALSKLKAHISRALEPRMSVAAGEDTQPG
jgi:RNA polymerase sigma factor for flagellar operon FliA